MDFTVVVEVTAAAGCTLHSIVHVLKKIELEVKKFLFFLFLPLCDLIVCSFFSFFWCVRAAWKAAHLGAKAPKV